MKINTAEEMVKSGGLGEGNAFSIAASSKAFEVLSSNLYQNKILAVIREISCNAADAHKLAGRPLADIDVHLPTFGEPWFSVRDYGPSLSHDAVLKLYTTYFLSTKDSDNELIGGFGLGSKAPFAVADQFTVTTWRDGLKRTYVCYKQNGVPQINKVGEDASSEPTGLEVKVAVKSGTVSQWVTEAHTYFGWWPEVPAALKNVTHHSRADNFLVKSDRNVGAFPAWAMLKEGTFDARPRVVMGLVPYALELGAIPGLPQDLVQQFTSGNLLLSFDVGELEINPSRETLSYDPATCAAITRRLREVSDGLVKQIEDSISTAPTLWDARKLAVELQQSSSLYRFVERVAKKVRWQGQQVFGPVSLDLAKDFDAPAAAHFYMKRNYRKTWIKAVTMYGEYVHHANRGHATIALLFHETTITAKTYKKVAHYMTETWPEVTVPHYSGSSVKQNPSYEAVIITGPQFDNFEKVCADKGLPPVLKVADLPDPPAAPKNKGTMPAKTQGYRFKKDGGYELVRTPLDLTGGGYYVPFEDGYPAANSVRDAIQVGLLSADEVIGISYSRLKTKAVQTMLEDNGWEEFILSKALAGFTDQDVEEQVQYSRLRDLTSSYVGVGNSSDAVKKYFTNGVTVWKGRWKDTDLEEAADYVLGVQKFYSATKTVVWNRFYSFLMTERSDAVNRANQKHAEYEALVDAACAKHPMLTLLNWAALQKSDLAQVVDYLKRS